MFSFELLSNFPFSILLIGIKLTWQIIPFNNFTNALASSKLSLLSFAKAYSKDILLYSLRNHEDSIESSKLFKVAEDSYRNGYLENSAVSYYNYLNTNPSKTNKILTYKRLFEINVLRSDIPAAFEILNQLEELSPNDLSVSINRLKLLLREENFTAAKIFIDANYGKLNCDLLYDAGKFRACIKRIRKNSGEKTRLFVYQKDCTLLRKAKSIIQSVVVLT